MSWQLYIGVQTYSFIEEVTPEEENWHLQEESDKYMLQLQVDLNTSQKFEEQVENQGPANKDILESLLVVSQEILSDSQLLTAVKSPTPLQI